MSLRLSIIIPTLNEEHRLGEVLEHVRRGGKPEVIVADGGSTDRTCQVAESAAARVVISQRGRGTQLNLGAAAATGDALLFLHADTLPPPDYEQHIDDILARPGVCAGAFGLRIDAPQRALRLIEKTVNWRSRVLGLPYGDQGIFVTREAFEEVGGFPEIPVMEDFVFVRRLRRLGRIQIAPAAVLTSARRWSQRGVWRTTLLNQLTIAAYYLGVSPHRIAAWRGGVPPADRKHERGDTTPIETAACDNPPAEHPTRIHSERSRSL